MPRVRATFNCQTSEGAETYLWFSGVQRVGETTGTQLVVELDLEYGEHEFAVRGANADGLGPITTVREIVEEPYVPQPPGPIGDLSVSIVTLMGGGFGGGPAAPAGGTNAVRIAAVMNGRTPHFTYNMPADPIPLVGNDTTVTTAAEFNAAASIAQTKITINNSFTGNVNISAADIDVVMNNSATIDGNLNITTSTRDRVRWTGGNINGSFDVARGTDFLMDDVYVNTPDSAFNAAGGDGRDRFAFINSTFARNGTGGINAWAFYTFNQASPALYDDYLIGNCLFTGTSPDDSLVRLQSIDGAVIVDSVFNPLGNALHGLRFHDGNANVYMRNSWIRGDFKIDSIGDPANASGPSIGNADLEGIDVYNPGSLTFTSFVDDFPQESTQNSGTLANCTHYTEGTVGSFPTPTGFTDGGGNTQESWDGSTLPDYSAVGAVRA